MQDVTPLIWITDGSHECKICSGDIGLYEGFKEGRLSDVKPVEKVDSVVVNTEEVTPKKRGRPSKSETGSDAQ